MKKFTLLTLALLSLSFFAQAQITKGAILLGGGIGFSKGTSTYETINTNPNSSKPYTTSIYPAVGVAIKENTILGIFLNYGQGRNYNSDNQNSQQFNSYGGGIFLRKYKLLGKNFYLFGEANGGYDYSKYIYTSAINTSLQRQEEQYNNIGLNLYPGISYALSRKFHIEASLYNIVSLGYNTRKSLYMDINNPLTTIKTNTFSLATTASGSVPLSVGLRFFL